MTIKKVKLYSDFKLYSEIELSKAPHFSSSRVIYDATLVQV